MVCFSVSHFHRNELNIDMIGSPKSFCIDNILLGGSKTTDVINKWNRKIIIISRATSGWIWNRCEESYPETIRWLWRSISRGSIVYMMSGEDHWHCWSVPRRVFHVKHIDVAETTDRVVLIFSRYLIVIIIRSPLFMKTNNSSVCRWFFRQKRIKRLYTSFIKL